MRCLPVSKVIHQIFELGHNLMHVLEASVRLVERQGGEH